MTGLCHVLPVVSPLFTFCILSLKKQSNENILSQKCFFLSRGLLRDQQSDTRDVQEVQEENYRRTVQGDGQEDGGKQNDGFGERWELMKAEEMY